VGTRRSPRCAIVAVARVLAFQEERLLAVIAFETRAGLIMRIHSIANPHKLAQVAEVEGDVVGLTGLLDHGTSGAVEPVVVTERLAPT
jgi:hypothetical protein